jgi:hypothetical protein
MTKIELTDHIEALRRIRHQINRFDALAGAESEVTLSVDDDHNFIGYTLSVTYAFCKGGYTFEYDFLSQSELYSFLTAMTIGVQINNGEEV